MQELKENQLGRHRQALSAALDWEGGTLRPLARTWAPPAGPCSTVASVAWSAGAQGGSLDGHLAWQGHSHGVRVGEPRGDRLPDRVLSASFRLF